MRLLVAFAVLVGLQASAQSAPRNGGDFSNNTQPLTKVPAGVTLVKGAWSSASDSVTPVRARRAGQEQSASGGQHRGPLPIESLDFGHRAQGENETRQYQWKREVEVPIVAAPSEAI